MDHTIVISPFEDSGGVATIAGTTSLAVDNDLGVEANRRGTASQIIQNLEAISDRRSATLRPARATITGNVLVLVPRHVVLTIHVPPVNIGRKIILAVDVPSIRSGLHVVTVGEISMFDTATAGLGEETISIDSHGGV